MSAVNQIRDAVVQTLKTAGLDARGAWDAKAGTISAPLVCADVETTTARPMALGGYLGQIQDESGVREVYGRELEAVVALDVRAPSAAECTAALERACDALSAGLPPGLRLRRQDWEAVTWERGNRCFFRRCRLRCGAYFTAEAGEESGTLLEFRLVLESPRQDAAQ